MLNLPIAMFSIIKRTSRLFFLVIAFIWVNIMFVLPGYAQDAAVQIDAPANGEALQGVVMINGTTAMEGLRSVEVSFAYQKDPTNTWFPIWQGSAAVKNGLLARWDTSTIADGNYRLRVQVVLQDGRVLESVVNDLRVRNYSVVETSTPAAGQRRTEVLALTATPLPDFQPAAVQVTPLPTNPAQLTEQDLRQSALTGVGIVAGAFVLLGIYIGLRSIGRKL